MKIKVRDVTAVSFHGYVMEDFSTLADAFAYVAEQMQDYADDADYGKRFEIEIPGEVGHNVIEVDARHVNLTTIFPND